MKYQVGNVVKYRRGPNEELGQILKITNCEIKILTSRCMGRTYAYNSSCTTDCFTCENYALHVIPKFMKRQHAIETISENQIISLADEQW